MVAYYNYIFLFVPRNLITIKDDLKKKEQNTLDHDCTLKFKVVNPHNAHCYCSNMALNACDGQ